MNEGMAMDNFYKQELGEYLRNQEYKKPIEDFKGNILDLETEIVYQLESNTTTFYFAKSDAVEFYDWLKNKYSDTFKMLDDFNLDTKDLVMAITDGEFSTDGTMDFLLFLGAEKLEA
jgi:hypothetical protein